MPAHDSVDLTVDGHLIPATEWTWGSEYPKDRRWTNGWGTSIEVPAVIELLELIAAGKTTAVEVKSQLTDAANKVIARCDIYKDDEGRAVERCFGDCDQCEAREPEFRAALAKEAQNAANAADPAYEHVVSGATVHTAACKHVERLSHYRPPRDEDDFRSQLHMFVHQGISMGLGYTALTAAGLREWCAAHLGPQGGRKYRACRTCEPQLP
ncbi:hypothetical protein AR457_39910 [Streptomyces agglomeratus]|uniref:hypothetical protein n=1 Tax=Streptomyces agglomeratus TaxID=285458 RepID=UPI00085276D6|nr:hypothetical protein [Streptomyces agglomeratus]OEJ21861.1 hypothetical protein AR457_38590 [Streptomyces agglomeratus]OEJ22062.1 hypothetical protein AR457_39910 [Streptomyces agglomeratus]OEJ36899.1 hypothetical protein BGK70_00565 [Streptomyces agglomeratus]